MLSSSTASTLSAIASCNCASVSTSSSIFTRWPTPAPRALDRGAHAAGDGDVVVLDQHGVIQAEPVVRSAADPHRVFLREPQPRHGLAGAAHLRPGAGDGVGDAARAGRDAAEVAEEVQRRPLRRQDAAGGAADRWRSRRRVRGGCRPAAPPRPLIAGSISRNAAAAKSSPATTPACRATSAVRVVASGRDDGVGGEVAGAAEILQQRGAHRRLDHDHRQRGTWSSAHRQHALDRPPRAFGESGVDRHLLAASSPALGGSSAA